MRTHPDIGLMASRQQACRRRLLGKTKQFTLFSVTCNILMCDIKLARGTPSRSPHVVDFIKTALPQLCDLKDVDLMPNNCIVPPDIVMSSEKMLVEDLECVDLNADIDMVSLDNAESFEEDNKRKSAIKLSKTGQFTAKIT